jgi:hypothetical protein
MTRNSAEKTEEKKKKILGKENQKFYVEKFLNKPTNTLITPLITTLSVQRSI